MASRTIVSYDDITLPYEQPLPVRPPPSKKRKWTHGNEKGHQGDNRARHFTLPDIETHERDAQGDEDDDDQPEDSHELSHNEIWDDSALIDAWNAATEEYEAYNGPDKGWKTEPVHKSPLWYNLPNSYVLDLPVPNFIGSASDPTDVGVPPSVDQDEAFTRALSAMYWGGYWTAVYHYRRQEHGREVQTLQQR